MPARNGAVHVATTKRVYKGKTYGTHLLRRSIRKGKTVTHETLGNLSHLPDHLLEIIKRSLPAEAFRITRSLPHGHVDAVLTMIRKRGVEDLIASEPSRRRDLVIAMIVERLLFPSSKLANTRHHPGRGARRRRRHRGSALRRHGLAADEAGGDREEARPKAPRRRGDS